MSYWQRPELVDYEKIAEQVDGVILRIAYGVYKDKAFNQHYNNFTQLGVPVGGYHFLVEYEPAITQAALMIGVINDLPVVNDCGNGFGVVTQGLALGGWADVELEPNAKTLTRQTVDNYLGEVEQELGEFGVYSSKYYWDLIMKTDAYKSRKLWIAHYGAVSPLLPITGGWDRWWLWQYTSNGRLDGYNGSLDTNHFWGSDQDFNNWVGEDIVIPSPEPDKPLFRIEVINCIALNIREGPGTNYAIVGHLQYGDHKFVFEERFGWLKLTDGWISAAYAQRIYENYIPIIIKETELTLEEKVEKLWEAHPELH